MEQVERTRRYLERIRQAYAGVPYREDGREYYADEVHSFFVHCYHIRDWVLALNRVAVTKTDLDTFIDSHFELQVCADLCNGTKHCSLDWSRTSHQPHVAGYRLDSSGAGVGLGGERCRITKCQFEVLAEGEVHDALWLAEQCMDLWDGFIAGLESAS